MSRSDTLATCQIETATYLVNIDQSVSFRKNKDKVSPLYLAVEAGNISLVKAMLNRHERKTANLVSLLEGKKSLVHAALKAKNIDVLDVILKEDSSLVNERDEGRTCLSVGASVGFYKGICKLLDGSTANVYECDDDGSFPIHVAVEKGHVDVIKEILKRCPDSIELRNRQGQNILHIASKTGKVGYFLLKYMRSLDIKKNHLIEEKDVDGNTPLHLATINWRPQTIFSLTRLTSTIGKVLNIRNNDGQTALDIAERNLQPNYILRERTALMVLLTVYAPRDVGWLTTSGMTLRSRSENLNAEKYKEHINALLVVATLVATVAFAAGFTLPGGFNSSAPNPGMAILAKNRSLSLFLFFDTVALQSSVVAIISLIWAQLADPEIVQRAFHLALPSLFIALCSMSFAFTCGVQATIVQNIFLLVVISSMSSFFYSFLFMLLAPYVIPQVPGVPFLQVYSDMALAGVLMLVKEDAEKHDTLSSGKTLRSVNEGKTKSGNRGRVGVLRFRSGCGRKTWVYRMKLS